MESVLLPYSNKNFRYSGVHLCKTFLAINSCTVPQIFLIKNTLLSIISSILCNTPLLKDDEFILQLKSSTNISHAWEDCKYWDVCPITGIPSYIITPVNQKIIVTNMNYKFNEYADIMKNNLGVRQMGGTLTLELICK